MRKKPSLKKFYDGLKSSNRQNQTLNKLNMLKTKKKSLRSMRL